MHINNHCWERTHLRTTRGRRGLTLTELLTAILIIAILIALLFPFVSRMREKARSAKCVQNLRQIGIALRAHMSENNGRFPNGAADVSWWRADIHPDPLGICWYDAAAQHLGRNTYSMRFNDPAADPLPGMFCCPSGHAKPYHPAWPYTGDYAANSNLGNTFNESNPLTLSAVRNPSTTPYVQDTVMQNNFGAWIFNSGFSPQANAAFAARHNGKGNILWVDGHVSSLTYHEYMKMANDPRYGGVINFLRGNW